MSQTIETVKADVVGALASGLCLIHCAATPFLFVAKASTIGSCGDAPIWWQAIDYLFIVVSFAAIYYATKRSSKKWIRIALWSSWALLVVTVLSETLEAGIFPSAFVYVPALAIVGFHIYNLKYCQCKVEQGSVAH